ncbi:MAG: amidohydrolase family protein [Anaerolineae bacterium]|nr:amidohydrolase family protein [Anaerolineae bacterium]
MLKLPGLIDVHTHLRTPGGEHKEDFASGTAAALAGGITLILAMPNTNPPLATLSVLEAARQQAQRSIYCDVGLFAGASPTLVDQLPLLTNRAVALKIYLNETFGPLRVEDLPTLLACCRRWPRTKVIALHAEGPNVAVGIGLAAAFQRPIHLCHISRKDEIELIAAAKRQGLPVTCEVTPHHLFLTQADAPRLGPLADMRPRLAEQTDQAALWEHLDSTIDCIATDHAPHTLAEKAAATPPPGVPGLETSLPLLLTAVKEKRLSLDRLITLMHTNPKRIFKLSDQPDTYIEVDSTTSYILDNANLQTKCGWTPFAGMTVKGRVMRVVLRGQPVYNASRSGKENKILAPAGTGRLLP